MVRTLLDEVTRSGRTRGAVVADGAGLVIAASGGDGEALAAAAAVFVESAGRVLRSVLPLGTLQNLSVVDENDVTIAALPLAVGDHPLILATLSDGPGPDPASLRAVVARA
jgi:predicted regulator of Ras-like GTPase activity (Roadblock/LC7/MglB family)